MTDDQYILLGHEVSLYCGKVRAYLRYKQIPFEERLSTDIYNEIKKHVGWEVVPVIVTPDGEYIQDTTVIIDYFEDILGADDVECMKPSACPLDITVKRFNISKERTMIVGDMDIDILAGKKAGIWTCAVTYGIGEKAKIIKAKPDYIIDSLLKLKEIIN